MSKYICDTCNKPKPIDTSTLQVGEKVNFTVEVIGRNSASFKSKTGVIEAIEGDMCSVKYGGNTRVIKRSELTPHDAPSPLTWCFGGCECEEAPF